MIKSVIEEVLKNILGKYDGNKEYYVQLSHDDLPQYLQGRSTEILESLKANYLISRYEEDLSGIELYLTPAGINYFVKEIPSNSMQLLDMLLKVENPVQYMEKLFEGVDNKMDSRLRAMMRDLKENGYLTAKWASNVPYIIDFNEKAYALERKTAEKNMKGDLLELIAQISDIKSHFHLMRGDGMAQMKVIYNTPEFAVWKQSVQFELQDIYDRTRDSFIWNALTDLKQGFNGWKDERQFNELEANLLVIGKNIDKYYPTELPLEIKTREEDSDMQKSPKVFISHSSQDKDYVSALVELLEGLGLNESQIFCSSVPVYDIPLNEDIFDYLKLQFENHSLHVIYILSGNYYDSVACMNEMGAAWILQNKYTTILLPGFAFKEIQGAINPRQIGLKLDSEVNDIKNRLGQLKNDIIEEFQLHSITDVRWESKRDTFIGCVHR